MHDHKLKEACNLCIISDCRFKNDPDRYEPNCPGDPWPHSYPTGSRPHDDRQKQRESR